MTRLAAALLLAALAGCSRDAAPSADEQETAALQRATERKAADDLRAAELAARPSPAR